MLLTLQASWLVPLFLGELAPQLRVRFAHDLDALEAQLAGAFTAARLAWPGVELAADRFARHLAAAVDDDPADAPLITELHAGDLYLAAACAANDPVAVTVLERNFLAQLVAPLSSTGLDRDGIDEVQQVVREMLLVGRDGVPGIATYRGRGSLRSWLRAVAVRQAMMHFRSRREPVVGDDALEAMPAIAEDPELAPWKHQYAAAFRTAFEAAILALEPQQRTLIRQHHIDHLSIDALAHLYKVHRATAARWVAAARESLLTDVRTRVAASLGIDGPELASVFRLARSQLDVSIPRLLGLPDRR